MHYANIFYNYRTNTMHWYEYDEEGVRTLKKCYWVPYFYVNQEAKKYDGLSIYGEKLIKVKPKSWSSFKEMRRSYQDAGVPLFESDVKPEIKFLQDNFSNQNLLSKIPELDIHYLDIEAEVGDHFVTGMEASERINLISITSTKWKKTFVFGLEKDYQRGLVGVKYFQCKDEADLLTKYLKFHAKSYPDIITGWNIENYDIPYIINRITKILGENKAKRFSPFNQVRYNERNECYEIGGISLLDYMLLYKKYAIGNRERYSLEHICKYEKIKKQKIKFQGSMKDFYQNHWEDFVEYNIMDSKLVLDLEKKLNYLALSIYLSYSSLIKFQDVFSSLRTLDGAMIHHCHKKNRIVPDRGEVHTSQAYEGAYVFEPVPGMYDWVVGWDVSSLYPSTMRMLNISPETKRFKVQDGNYFEDRYPITLRCFTDGKNYILNSKEEMQQLLKDEDVCISRNQILYTNKTKGVISSILDGWYEDRVEVKKRSKFYQKKAYEEKDKSKKKELKAEAKRLDIQQWALKIRMNSLYGYIGTPFSRFFDWDNSMAVTITGQHILKSNNEMIRTKFPKIVNKKLKGDDFPVTIYGDTDSLYLHYGYIIREIFKENPKTDEEWLKSCNRATKIIDRMFRKYNGIQRALYNTNENLIFFDVEAIDKAAIFLCKKRYIAWVIHDSTPCDKLEYKGIEIVKSSTPLLFKDYLKETVGMIIKGADRQQVNDKIKEIHSEVISKPVEELGFPRSANNIGKYEEANGSWRKGTPIHIKASITYNHLLKKNKLQGKYNPIYSGNKMSFLYLRHHKYGVIGFVDELPKEFDIEKYVDIDKQFQKGFEAPVQQFFDALKWGEINYNTFDLLA